MSDTVFRTRETAPETPEIAPQEAKAPEVTDSGNIDKAITPIPDFSPVSELEKWEIQNGKYGLEYLGIKEIGKTFPLNAQFGILDNYIKGELEDRGYDKTPTKWQDVLKEIETEIGSGQLDPIERLKRLSNYIKVLQKLNSTKKLRDAYLISDMSQQKL